jgi:foldase protein PrsA
MDPETHAPLGTNVIGAKRKQIEDLLKQIRAGGDFAALVKQYSEDPGSKETGGEYTFPRGQMDPAFESAAFSMTNNQISDVVTTSYGFHIIQTLEKKPAHKVLLTDKIPQSDVTIATSIKEGLINLKVRKASPDYVKKLRAEYKVEITDPTLKAEDEAFQVQADAAAAAPDAAAPSPAGAAGQ